MKRWHGKEKQYVENPKIDAFLHEVLLVCRKHDLSIGHQDNQGAFLIDSFSKDKAKWLHNATDMTDQPTLD